MLIKGFVSSVPVRAVQTQKRPPRPARVSCRRRQSSAASRRRSRDVQRSAEPARHKDRRLSLQIHTQKTAGRQRSPTVRFLETN